MNLKLYRFAGFSARHILGANAHYCVLVEMQHLASGELYHYHKDFPAAKKGLMLACVETAKVVGGKIPDGWELKPSVEEARALAKEVRDFVLWLTPCGQVEPGPTLAVIGEEARALYAKIQ